MGRSDESRRRSRGVRDSRNLLGRVFSGAHTIRISPPLLLFFCPSFSTLLPPSVKGGELKEKKINKVNFVVVVVVIRKRKKTHFNIYVSTSIHSSSLRLRNHHHRTPHLSIINYLFSSFSLITHQLKDRLKFSSLVVVVVVIEVDCLCIDNL